MSDFINTVDILGDEAVATAIIDRGISEYNDNGVKAVGNYAFYKCSKLTSVDLPFVTDIKPYAFRECTALTSANLPSVTNIGIYAFDGCAYLASLNLPSIQTIGTNAIQKCAYMTSVDLHSLLSISSKTFYYCYSLTSVVLRSTTLCKLGSTDAFTSCYRLHGTVNSTYNPNGEKCGYIYVPRDLVESYKVATNWSTFSTQFRALEDYTVDGTITGELDTTKI